MGLSPGNFPGNSWNQKLYCEISWAIHTYKTAKWREFLEEINLGEGTGKLWSTLKQFNRQPQVPDNQPVSFYSGTFRDDHRCAILFNQQFTPHLPTTSNKGSSSVCKFYKLHCKEMEITSLQVATKASEVLGPDGIALIHLKHLGPGSKITSPWSSTYPLASASSWGCRRSALSIRSSIQEKWPEDPIFSSNCSPLHSGEAC